MLLETYGLDTKMILVVGEVSHLIRGMTEFGKGCSALSSNGVEWKRPMDEPTQIGDSQR